MSHPTMGAWIEILNRSLIFLQSSLSHPTMGAWIEIILLEQLGGEDKCRTPRWVRGLKLNYSINKLMQQRRTPRWVRGLK